MSGKWITEYFFTRANIIKQDFDEFVLNFCNLCLMIINSEDTVEHFVMKMYEYGSDVTGLWNNAKQFEDN